MELIGYCLILKSGLVTYLRNLTPLMFWLNNRHLSDNYITQAISFYHQHTSCWMLNLLLACHSHHRIWIRFGAFVNWKSITLPMNVLMFQDLCNTLFSNPLLNWFSTIHNLFEKRNRLFVCCFDIWWLGLRTILKSH